MADVDFFFDFISPYTYLARTNSPVSRRAPAAVSKAGQCIFPI
jgi:2-hydroxychromene-2-carboxylate isomerase